MYCPICVSACKQRASNGDMTIGTGKALFVRGRREVMQLGVYLESQERLVPLHRGTEHSSAVLFMSRHETSCCAATHGSNGGSLSCVPAAGKTLPQCRQTGRDWPLRLATAIGHWDWTLRLATEIGHWDWPLRLDTEIGRWDWPLRLATEIGHWDWPLRLDTEIGHWDWSLRLDTEFGHWDWTLRLDTEIGHWDWTLRLATEIGHWDWPLKLDTEIGHWDWPLRLATGRDFAQKK